ncbi:MAG: hypothetical protein ACI9WU_004992 [Myxococcota bacterium]|jgi:hypothetical protein
MKHFDHEPGVASEWSLVCTDHNLLKLFRFGVVAAARPPASRRAEAPRVLQLPARRPAEAGAIAQQQTEKPPAGTGTGESGALRATDS